MKIPDQSEWFHNTSGSHLYSAWKKTAHEIGMASGIYVSVICELHPFDAADPDGSYIKRLYFKVMDHEFEGSDELKKALENKAFL